MFSDQQSPIVPFLDVAASYRELKFEIDAAVSAVLGRGQYVLGDEVEAFEQSWARYVGATECVGTGSGLDAIAFGLSAAGVRARDDVIVPTHTFIATWLAVLSIGANVIPVEPDPRTYNIDPSRIEEAITRSTRAIVPVHLYGQPVDMSAIAAIAEQHGLVVVADAAQAHGAAHAGSPVGALAHATAWSFYPAKNLGAVGDGGAVTTNSPEIAKRVRRLRNYGSTSKYAHEVIGHNSRLDEIQAAVLSVKLKALDSWNQRRAAIAAAYIENLGNCDGIALPVVPPWASPTWHLFVIRTPHRDRLRNDLRDAGIETLIHYPIPPHQQPALSEVQTEKFDLRIAERLASEVISLPIGPHMTASQIDRVIDAVRAATAGY